MDVGVFYFPVDYGINVAELAKALEDRGFGSLYVPEHTHIPLSRKTPFPGGGELPKRYAHTHDPFVALATFSATNTASQFSFQSLTGENYEIQYGPSLSPPDWQLLQHITNAPGGLLSISNPPAAQQNFIRILWLRNP